MKTIIFMTFFFLLNWGRWGESLFSHHRQYPCGISSISRAVFLRDIIMTGIKQGGMLLSQLVALKGDAR